MNFKTNGSDGPAKEKFRRWRSHAQLLTVDNDCVFWLLEMLFFVQTINALFVLFRLEMNAFYILVEIMRSESTALFIVLLNLVTARYSDFLFDYKFFSPSLHLPSDSEGSVLQVIGDKNLIMGSCHIAHDCTIGNNNIFANNTLFAGHVVVEVSNHFTMVAFSHQLG